MNIDNNDAECKLIILISLTLQILFRRLYDYYNCGGLTRAHKPLHCLLGDCMVHSNGTPLPPRLALLQ